MTAMPDRFNTRDEADYKVERRSRFCRSPRIIGVMRGRAQLIVAVALAIGLSGCESPEPLGPTPVDQGVIVYLNSGYRGVSQQVGADVDEISGRLKAPATRRREARAPGTICISSIRVLPGWHARIYGDKNYRGAVLEVTADVPDLSRVHGSCSDSYDDCISSICVIKN